MLSIKRSGNSVTAKISITILKNQIHRYVASTDKINVLINFQNSKFRSVFGNVHVATRKEEIFVTKE